MSFLDDLVDGVSSIGKKIVGGIEKVANDIADFGKDLITKPAETIKKTVENAANNIKKTVEFGVATIQTGLEMGGRALEGVADFGKDFIRDPLGTTEKFLKHSWNNIQDMGSFILDPKGFMEKKVSSIIAKSPEDIYNFEIGKGNYMDSFLAYKTNLNFMGEFIYIDPYDKSVSSAPAEVFSPADKKQLRYEAEKIYNRLSAQIGKQVKKELGSDIITRFKLDEMMGAKEESIELISKALLENGVLRRELRIKVSDIPTDINKQDPAFDAKLKELVRIGVISENEIPAMKKRIIATAAETRERYSEEDIRQARIFYAEMAEKHPETQALLKMDPSHQMWFAYDGTDDIEVSNTVFLGYKGSAAGIYSSTLNYSITTIGKDLMSGYAEGTYIEETIHAIDFKLGKLSNGLSNAAVNRDRARIAKLTGNEKELEDILRSSMGEKYSDDIRKLAADVRQSLDLAINLPHEIYDDVRNVKDGDHGDRQRDSENIAKITKYHRMIEDNIAFAERREPDYYNPNSTSIKIMEFYLPETAGYYKNTFLPKLDELTKEFRNSERKTTNRSHLISNTIFGGKKRRSEENIDDGPSLPEILRPKKHIRKSEENEKNQESKLDITNLSIEELDNIVDYMIENTRSPEVIQGITQNGESLFISESLYSKATESALVREANSIDLPKQVANDNYSKAPSAAVAANAEPYPPIYGTQQQYYNNDVTAMLNTCEDMTTDTEVKASSGISDKTSTFRKMFNLE